MTLKKTKIIKQFTKEWKGMENSLITFCTTNDPEELHLLRVHIKKIKFMLFFTEGKNKSVKKDFLPIKFLFKESGDIRSLYIYLALLKKHKILLKQIEHQFNEDIAHKTRLLLLHQPRYTRQVSQLRKKTEQHIKSLNEKTVFELFSKKIKKLTLLYKKRFNHPSEIHASRKVLKQLVYFNYLVDKKTRNKLKLNGTYMDHLQTEIGNWHDLHDTILYLKNNSKAPATVLKKLMQLNSAAISKVKKETKGFKTKLLLS